MNLVELIKSYMPDDLTEKAAQAMGETPDRTRGAINAAVPAMLAGFSSVASTPDGAQRLYNTMDAQDENVISRFTRPGGPGLDQSMISKASGMLSSLMGGGLSSGLTSALSKFTGFGGGSITTLLAMIGPLVLGVLKKQSSSMGLDAGGLSKLFSSQKQNIVGAMPSGLAGALSGVPGLSSLSEGVRSAAGAVGNVGRQAAAQTQYAARSAAPAGSSALKWVIPAVVLVALGALLLSMFNRPSATPINPPVRNPQPSATLPPPQTDAVQQLTSSVNNVFDGVKQSLSTVSDATTAEAAAPQIQQATSRLDDLITRYKALPEGQRGTITNLIQSEKTSLQPVIDRLKSIPGVTEKIGPQLDGLTDKLNAFSR